MASYPPSLRDDEASGPTHIYTQNGRRSMSGCLEGPSFATLSSPTARNSSRGDRHRTALRRSGDRSARLGEPEPDTGPTAQRAVPLGLGRRAISHAQKEQCWSNLARFAEIA